MALKLLALLVVAVAAEERVSYRNHKVLQVPVRNAADAEKFNQLDESGFDVWSMEIGKAAYVRVAPWDLAYVNTTLADLGMTFSIVNHDLQETFDKERAMMAEINIKRGRSSWVGVNYVRYSEIVDWILSLPNLYGNKVAVQSIGKSYENRDIYVIRVSNNVAQSGNRKAIFLEANIHAREWLSHASLAYVLQILLTEYGVNQRITAALDNFEWHFILMSNPDGYEYTHTNERLWRKTRSRYPNSVCYGVDANRNFDSHHCEAGASTNPCHTTTYCGPSPFSEKETQAIRDYTTAIKDRLVVFQSVHTYSQFILIPYGYAVRTYPPDYDELKRVGDLMADTILQTSRKVYKAGNVVDLLRYRASGSSIDWARDALNTKYVYTWELRPAQGDPIGFVAPPSEIAPTAEELLAAQLTLVDNIKL